ncbi:MAG: ABC transporter ATP-binding protein [Gemmatimonadota bacterium]|nr:ABC transporter ATP-binding protein [Gemmatimonadota bacterium]
MAQPTVVLSDLSRRFRDVEAVDRLTFSVGRGELFGIVGPDGAGKTTTLRMLAGVLRPTGGDARVGGVSVTRDPEGVKRHIAYMSQRFGLYTDLTVRENIDFYADLFRVPADQRARRLERLYQFSGLGPFERRLAGQLSGGMKQKLGLCCALVHEPEIMLLDEPTFGVDPISRRDLWLIVHEMVAAGITVLVATAYLDEAERCDRVAMLHAGQLLALDTPEGFRRRLTGRIQTVRTSAPRQTRDLVAAHPAVQHAVLFGDMLHAILDDPARDWPDVKSRIASAGITILEEAAGEPSLEDVFIHLVTSAPAHA